MKKYKITSKFRFTMFLAIMILCIFAAVGIISGTDNVSGDSMTQYNCVTVHSGDTLWDIASEYGPSDMDIREVVYDICQLNDISADRLDIGADIMIPVYHS